MKDLVKIVGKLVVAGTIIFGIGFFVLVQDKDEAPGEVAVAQADLKWTDSNPAGRFTNAMADIGLTPRAYNLNGNVMYFAEATSPKTPKQLLADLQNHLVEYGVNDRAYTEVKSVGDLARMRAPSSKEKLDKLAEAALPSAQATLNGNVVPVRIDDRYVAMSGLDWNGENEQEVVEQVQNADPASLRKDKFKKMFHGYKFIDATWEEHKQRSQITAVWTKDDFDANKLDNTAFVQEPPDPNVPPCIGCKRQFRMQSLEKDEPVQSNHWSTNSSPQQTYEFYVKAMANRGWTESKSQQFLNKAKSALPELQALHGRMLNLEKDGKQMTIAIIPGENGGSEIMSQERYRGGTSILTK